jgi:Spx/MgsR family transcriptional regulator
MYTIYGIPNCDTIKKTLQWFRSHDIPYEFHDYKQSGISIKKLEQWSSEAGIEKLLNKKSTTWRSLTNSEKESSADTSAAQKLMREKPEPH